MKIGLLLILLAPAFAAPSFATEMRFLVAGDSHSAGPFGKTLDKALRAIPASKEAIYAVASASPKSYFEETSHSGGYLFSDYNEQAPRKLLVFSTRRTSVRDKISGALVTRVSKTIKTPKLATLIEDHNPTVTIIALGSNASLSEASIKETIDLIHKKKSACVWVGPPYMRRVSKRVIDKNYETLRKYTTEFGGQLTLAQTRTNSCLLFDSGYMKYPSKGGDGRHYSGSLAPLGRKWGEDVAKAVLEASKTL